MDYLAAMRAFVRSVELGSFSKAAAEDNQKVSTVSRYVSALEADLGAALLNRSTRRLHLTEVGTALYERAVAVRIGALADSSLIAKRQAPQRRLLVCSPGYLAKHGAPAEPGDLLRLECLTLALQPSDSWYFSKPGQPVAEPLDIKVGGAFRANDSEALLGAARADMGIALLPSWLLQEDLAVGRLISLLPDFAWRIARGPERAIWGVYPPKIKVSPKVRAFLAFFAERFGNPPYWDR